MASSQDAWYLSLLGLAEHFRSRKPADIKSCVRCLQAVFNFSPPPRVEARTHLQLGNILQIHTKNTELARKHLEKAWELAQAISSFDDVKFESASVLAHLFEQQQQQKWAKERLRRAIEISQGNCYWHCRLLLQLAQLHARERDFVSACSLLGVGVEYTRISGAGYTQVLFLLSKAMLLLAERKLAEAAPLLQQAGALADAWQGSAQQKEYLKVYFLVLQTCHYLLAGQVKCSKSWLKQLQQAVQDISQWADDQEGTPAAAATTTGDGGAAVGEERLFRWMPREELCVVVYLVTVMHSMQAGYMDKAQKYSDKALAQINRLTSVDERPILGKFQLMILEHIVQCRLVMGDNTAAIDQVATLGRLCNRQPSLLTAHRAQIHTLLGLYAMSMNCMDAAEAQLNAALRTSRERELWTFVNMNLAIVYLRVGRRSEFAALLDRIRPESLPSQSHSLRAASYYVLGLHGFFQRQYNDAKRYLRETLKMANAEDLNRLTSCSLVLLGNIFLTLGNNRDSFNMVTPAMQLASKIPDVNIQLWASAVLRDLYRSCGEHAKESAELHKQGSFSQLLTRDQLSAAASPHHALLAWTDGPLPIQDAGAAVAASAGGTTTASTTTTGATTVTASVTVGGVSAAAHAASVPASAAKMQTALPTGAISTAVSVSAPAPAAASCAVATSGVAGARAAAVDSAPPTSMMVPTATMSLAGYQPQTSGYGAAAGGVPAHHIHTHPHQAHSGSTVHVQEQHMHGYRQQAAVAGMHSGVGMAGMPTGPMYTGQPMPPPHHMYPSAAGPSAMYRSQR